MNSTYKDLCNQAAPSETLIAATKKAMKNRAEIKENAMPRYISAAAALVLIIAAAAVLPGLLKSKDFPPETHGNAAVLSEPSPKNQVSPAAEITPQITPQSPPLIKGQHQESVTLSNGTITFNDNASLNTAKLYIDPLKTYREIWNESQVTEYLGTEFRPSYIPSGIKGSTGTPSWEVVFNNDGTIAYDTFGITYSENFIDEYNPQKRTLNIEVSKEKLPIQCAMYLNDEEIASDINGIKLAVGYCRMDYGPYSEKDKTPAGYYDVYVAEFMYKNIGYYVQSENLTQEEFINVLLSIVKYPPPYVGK